MEKVVFCGFGKLGRDCLEALIEEGYAVEYVMTHKENLNDSVDTFARTRGIEYSYSDARKHLKTEIQKISHLSPKFFISVNYRYIIPKQVYTLAEFALNIHGSLLPLYRGRTPHVWSILNGERESGITCHLIEETVDTGDIISQQVIPIGVNDTGYTLLKKFEAQYPALLIESMVKLMRSEQLKKQDNEYASYYGKRTPDMGYIDFRKTAREVNDFIRAQAEPYPGAYYYLIDGRKIIINKIEVHESEQFDAMIGVIFKKHNQYYVKCKDCILRIEAYRVID